MKKNSLNLIVIVIFIVIVAAVVAIIVWQSRPVPSIPVDPNALSAQVAKPRPVTDYFEGCPPSGSGGDPVLNTLKNRIDEGAWASTTISEVLSLAWPEAIEYQSRTRWSPADAAAVAQYEGAPLQLEGYLLSAKKMSPESCNCRSVEHVDYHIWLADDPNKDRAQSVVIEITPRVQVHHPEWTSSRLQQLVRNRERVRISGWLLMDPEHPDQIGKTRGTIWEIHPVMQIETRGLGGWQPLDNGTTGISSAPAVAQTAPPVTPDPTATTPPVGDRNVQDNSTVQITHIEFDGSTRNEPDEYVEITNNGNEPVDITDWELQDTSGSREYKWEQHTLQPGASIRVYTNEVHSDTGGFSFGSGQPLWRNGGDVAELYDADRQLVSRYAYGDRE
jgi:hypothetical protein